MAAKTGGDLAELPAQLAELRELIRQAHGATKDLRAAIREARKMTDDMADACAKAAYEASNDEMARWAAHVQREMNTRAADLNRAVDAARRHIISQLTMTRLIPSGDGLRVEFAGANFDDDVPAAEPDAT
jgi:uncharacterized protein YukE